MHALPFGVAFLEFFSEVPDPRQQAKVLYPLDEIVLTTLCAVICGAESYVEIEEFGNAKLLFLKQFLPFKNGIPSHDTYGIIFSKLDSKVFNEVFSKWVKSIQKKIPKLVAIDGKTSRNSKSKDSSPIHTVSAWAVEQNIVLGQLKIKEKSNEITAIPELLSLLVLNGAIVSIDAMGCQKDIAKHILERKADYVLSVKGNQSTLHKEIQLFFEGIFSGTFPFEVEKHETIGKDHGRIETRRYYLTDNIEWLSKNKAWPGLKTIGCVESVRETDDSISTELRYFISSLPANVIQFSQAVRGHWGIENGLHWVMDIVFRDDECRIRKKHGPANFVTIKHIAQNMLKNLDSKASMRVRRKRAGWDDNFLERALRATVS